MKPRPDAIAAKPEPSRHTFSSAWNLVVDFVRVAGKRGPLSLFYIFAAAALEGVGISLLVPLLGTLFARGGSPHWLQVATAFVFSLLGAHTRVSSLVALLGIFSALLLLRAVAILARDTAVLRLQLAFVESHQVRIADGLAAAPWEVLSGLKHAQVTQLMSGEVQRLGVGIHFLVRGAIALVVLLVQGVVALLLAPLAASGLIILLVIGTTFSWPLLRNSRSLGAHVAELNLSVLALTAQFLGGLKLAISHDLQSRFAAEVRHDLQIRFDGQLTFGVRRLQTQAIAAALFGLIAAAGTLAGLTWLNVSPSLLIALLLIVARTSTPLVELQQATQEFVQLLPVSESLEKLQRQLASRAGLPHSGSHSGAPRGTIVFEKVTFTPGDSSHVADSRQFASVLCAFDLTIEEGEFLAVTGASGSGKTTFADLLAGLCSPHFGRIRAGNRVLDNTTLNAWRGALAYVPQDPFLFHDTIRRNLTWANNDARDEEIWSALALAQAAEFTRSMKHGLDTIVGERGAVISGGERQRIALARALLRNPGLLVLDEATSSIDTESESRVFSALRELKPRPTVVLIAHRNETLALCDRIVRLEKAGGKTLACEVVSPRVWYAERHQSTHLNNGVSFGNPASKRLTA